MTLLPKTRRGSLLILVLIVLAMLILAGYSFLDQMQTRSAAAVHLGTQVQSRRAADAGVEYVLSILDAPDVYPRMQLIDNSELLSGRLVSPTAEDVDEPMPEFTILHSLPTDDGMFSDLFFGLDGESRRLNLNVVLQQDSDASARQMLMFLPNMTEFEADAILDWMDEDDTPREFGAELEYYSTLQTPVTPANAPPRSIAELLAVRDITPEKLFGEDANRNGILDPNENDGDASPPLDNADGVLDRGWVEFLTVISRDSRLSALGTPKININEPDLQTLYDSLTLVFDVPEAQYIVLSRLYQQLGNLPPIENPETPEIDITPFLEEEPQRTIGSVFDLVGGGIRIGQGRGGVLLRSPWSSEPELLAENLPYLLDNVTVAEGESTPGRLDINRCPQELLLGLPEMTEEMASLIVGSRPPIGTIFEAPDQDINATVGRLLTLNPDLFTIEQVKKWSPYLTVGSAVYRFQVLGHRGGSGPVVRYEVIVDGSTIPARVLSIEDLTPLGAGYTPDELGLTP